MRAVVQRVECSEVLVSGEQVGKIGRGLNVLIGVEDGDTEEDARYISEKIVNLRIFKDENDKMNYSVIDIKGEILAVSQFTLLGDCRKGRRPNFMSAAKPDTASELFIRVIDMIKGAGVNVESGIFQAVMLVKINNDGPVTILLDSRKRF